MDKEWIGKVSRILEEKLRVRFDYPLGYTPDVLPETWIEGETSAAYAIAKEHEMEVAKLRRDEQLAILSCGHSAAWADDSGCKACEYEKQIAHLIARVDKYLPIVQVVHSQMSSEYRANVLRGWAYRISEHNAVSGWLYELADALSSFAGQTE